MLEVDRRYGACLVGIEWIIHMELGWLVWLVHRYGSWLVDLNGSQIWSLVDWYGWIIDMDLGWLVWMDHRYRS